MVVVDSWIFKTGLKNNECFASFQPENDNNNIFEAADIRADCKIVKKIFKQMSKIHLWFFSWKEYW